jgi:hypothetical protein
MAWLDHMIDLFLILKETSMKFSKTAALDVGKDSRLETLCFTGRRFRITNIKEWKNIRKLERWTEHQEHLVSVSACEMAMRGANGKKNSDISQVRSLNSKEFQQ